MSTRSLQRAFEISGFTLVEVLVALTILGGGLFVLINSHFTALQLHLTTQEVVDERMLLESIVARADMGILKEELSGSGDFGARYLGFSWSYEAVPTGDTEHPLLADTQFYRVTVTLNRPDQEARNLDFYSFVNEETKSFRTGPL
ncbi:MAG: prepilin-type N-terminal cleavage/methylation domain-containing protein [Candidatus Hydrogenedens sp.]|jgi:prepilin-type N-terminal cleavage/methylation domain-containing protein|nr:prepilin-type N-terminal cleavage/methylation domain-containing protein [Candidatus Hydrogenedens sp.]